MKTITINVSEPVYREFRRFAKERDRSTSQLIRDAMEEYRDRRIVSRPSLKESRPISLGKLLRPIETSGLLNEMLNAQGH